MVPVGFSQVDSTTIAPSSTCQKFLSPSQPFRVFPSNMEVQPLWSLKSIGSGSVKPPPRPPRPVAGGCDSPGDTSKHAAKRAVKKRTLGVNLIRPLHIL